jgi:hypothetical protein
MQETPTVACTLTESGMSDRRGRWHALTDRAFVGWVVTDRGVRLDFRQEPGVEDELRELALLERDCCPFAEWRVSTVEGRAILNVTGGSDEAAAAVQQMFRTLAS